MSSDDNKRSTYTWNETVIKIAEKVGSDIRSNETVGNTTNDK